MTPGEKLGPYEILAPIGKGGMGEVYRARDTKLDRDVAIKVLPAALANNAERLARFEREAKVLAALNHPNIAAIYGLEDRAIIMELVEGPTLAERIAAGAIPLEESLKIAAQIADALEAAHEKGIVHRDLKPANVKAPHDAPVKVLDLGLATALPGTDRESSDLANSPTLTMGATEMGVILGTAAYMSPEQASGRKVDRRADIWSFGVVLFEMLTAKRMFDGGETVSHTLADVLRSEIDFSKLPAATPPTIRELLKRCLDRDVKTRLRDIGEARVGIQRWLTNPRHETEKPDATARHSSPAPWIAAAVTAVVVAGVAFWAPWRTPPIPEVVRFQVPPPEKSNFGPYPPAISPDGRQLAYIVGAGAEARIWVRSLDTLEARALPGTENAVSSVFWSPDGRSLGFQAAPPGPKLKRVEVAGGPPQTLCETPQPITGAWSPQGVIVFGLSGGLQRVPAGGGACTALTKVDPARGETFHRFPSFLPDGKHFLYLRVSGKTEFQGIYIGSLDADPSKPDLKRLLATDSRTIYAPPAGSGPGHLLFVREGSLMAQSFDPGRQELIGDAVPVAERVGNGSALVGQFFSVSANGALVYRTGVTAGGGNRRITVFDRQGKVVSTAGETAENTTPVFSPDGTLVAFQHADAPGSLPDIWLYDLIRKVPTRFTFDPAGDYAPVWSPDSRYVVFGSEREGGIRNLYRKVASNAGVEQVLLKSGDSKTALDWSRDGRFLLFIDVGSTTGADLWYLPLTGPEGTPGKAEPYLTSQFNDSAGRFAPDGRFVAYVSDASSRNDVYVRTFPDPSGGQWTVSTGGGTNPRWRRDGKELYYLAPGGSLMAVEVILSPTFKAGVPKEVFKFPLGQNFFDADAKGERFVKAVEVDAAPEGPPSPVTVVLNWAAGLRK